MKTLLLSEQTLGHITYMETIRGNVPKGESLHVIGIAPERKVTAWWPLKSVHRNYALHMSIMTRQAVREAPVEFETLIVHTQTAALLLPRRKPGQVLIMSSDGTPRNYDSAGHGYNHRTGKMATERIKQEVWRRTYQRADAVVAFSHWAADSMIRDYGLSPDLVRVIAPGTVIPAISRGPRKSGDKFRILFIGGDFERKGGDLLLQAVRGLPNVVVDVVTHSDVTPEPGVRVHRNVHTGDGSLGILMAAADVMVLPTMADMYSLASIEAMAAGLPVITTRVGGIPDIVIDRETGFLLNPGDIGAIRSAVVSLSVDPSRAEAMGRAGHDRALKHFNAKTQTARLFTLGQDLHHRRSRRSAGST